MAASISYQASATQGGAGPYSIAVSVASAAGQERLVAIGGISNNSINTVTFTSVTVDGQTATQVGSYVRDGDLAGDNGAIVSLWRANGTSGTSINVAFTASAAMFDGRCSVWTLNNADTVLATTTAISAGATSGAINATSLALNLNTVTDGVAAAVMLSYNSSTHTTTWTGLTERFDGGGLYGQDWYSVADAAITSGATPRTVTATLPSGYGSDNNAAAGLAVSFNPDAGGATTLTAAVGSYALTGSTASDKYVMPLGAAGA